MSENLINDLMSSVFEENPKIAMEMMLLAFKAPPVHKFVSENSDFLNETTTLTIKRGEAIFLYGACCLALGSISNDKSKAMESHLHTNVSKDYIGAILPVAELLESIGYPYEGITSDAIAIMYEAERMIKKVDSIASDAICNDMSIEELESKIGNLKRSSE